MLQYAKQDVGTHLPNIIRDLPELPPQVLHVANDQKQLDNCIVTVVSSPYSTQEERVWSHSAGSVYSMDVM